MTKLSMSEEEMLKRKYTRPYEKRIEELENKIADIKANCDLAIEGRDVKIKELETENNKLLDVINNQDIKIAELENEITEQKDLLTKAKEVIKTLADDLSMYSGNYQKELLVAKQFLQEIEND